MTWDKNFDLLEVFLLDSFKNYMEGCLHHWKKKPNAKTQTSEEVDIFT